MTTVSTYSSSPYTYIAGENYLLVVDADHEVVELIPYLDMRLSRGAEDSQLPAIAVSFCSRQQEPFLIVGNGEADLDAFHASLLAKVKDRCPDQASA
ncbi:hypothetical protein ACFFSY_25265 [Paenibacillus aurantiacus]|uniref:Uncharacterized protein n=1 Tax=Paenibacillus aurantiacus TaxID=1936118 RepID=A0ABV5KVK1_9BACL